MNLLIVTPSYFPVRGGGEQLVHDLAQRYASRYQVHIVTPQLPGTAAKEQVGEIMVHRFPIVRAPILDAISGQVALRKRLIELHKEHEYQFIQMFHLYQLGGCVVQFSQKNNIPLLTTLIGWDTCDPIRPVPRVFNRYLAYIMNHSTCCVTSSLHMARSARRQGCTKELDIVPHGTEMFDRPSGHVDIRKKYGIPSDKRIVLSVQRLAPRKGLGILIDTIALVPENDVVFLICGKGSERKMLETRAEENNVSSKVVFAGFVPDEELKDHYEQADIFALPSLYEGFGIVYIDALACGLPVVTTFCGGPEEVINETNGYLVPVEDADRFAYAISKALNRDWNHEGIRDAAQIYKWENIVERYERYFHDSER